MFMFIGIYFPCEKASRIKEVGGKVMTSIFNLFSLYYLTVLCFNAYKLDLKLDSEYITITLHFILATCIRLVFLMEYEKHRREL